MNKRILFLFTAFVGIAVFASCSKDTLSVSPNDNAKAKETSVTKTSAVASQGVLWIEGSLLVNNGVTASLAETNVCVSDVIVSFLKDGQIIAQYRPPVVADIANPFGAASFGSLPKGVKYERRMLGEQAVPLPKDEYDEIEISVNYVVRTLNSETNGIAMTCPYMQTVSYECSRESGYDYYVYVPINLHTIGFAASLDDWIES